MEAPTSDERREVAERLRELPSDIYPAIKEWAKDGLFVDANLSDEADYSQIHNAVFGCFPAEHMHPGDYEELHERLADLIDPTCHNEYSSLNDRSFRCSKCGYEAFTYGDSNCDPDEFEFCPYCGARVVEGSGD